MIGSPVLYEQLERELVELLGAEDVLLLQTLTHIHASVIPVLAGDGAIFIDARAHKTIYDGCVVARAHGATMQRFRHDDPDDLERLLASDRRYEALLYVDDGHGFGVVGQRSPDELSPYGRRGNSVARHLGQSYDHLILTGGFSTIWSSWGS